MTSSSSRQLGNAAWLLVTFIALTYAPMAIEYFAHLYTSGAPRLWLRLFTWVSSGTHAHGAGSVELEQRAAYAGSAGAMTLHTVCGGLVILLAVLQFHAGFRRRFPAVHRVLGRVQATVVVLAMLGAIAYLLRTGPAATYDGPAFYVQLWVLALATLGSTVLAVIAIRQRQVAMHYCLMALTFVLLLSAPGLRVGYLIMGGLDPSLTQEWTNMASAIIYAFLTAPFAVIASRVMDKRPASASAPSAELGTIKLAMTWLVGLAVAVCLGEIYQQQVGGWQGLHGALLGTALLTALLYGGALWRAKRRASAVARYEWSVHFAALGLVPVACGLLWAILGMFFTRTEAFWGAVMVGPGMALTLGLLVVVWSRRAHLAESATNQADLSLRASVSLTNKA